MKQPIVAITFDDCCATVATVAGPLFAARGVAGTFFVCGGYVGSGSPKRCSCRQPCPQAVTVEQLRGLQAAGWEIASHTWTHEKLDAVAPGTAEEEMTLNMAWLVKQGFKPRGLSYPWGRYSDRIMPVVIRTHAYARATSGTAPSTFPERYRHPATVLSNKTSAAEAIALVQANIRQGRNTVFFGHRLGPWLDGYTWAPESLAALIDASLAAGARVAPMGEIYP